MPQERRKLQLLYLSLSFTSGVQSRLFLVVEFGVFFFFRSLRAQAHIGNRWGTNEALKGLQIPFLAFCLPRSGWDKEIKGNNGAMGGKRFVIFQILLWLWTEGRL